MEDDHSRKREIPIEEHKIELEINKGKSSAFYAYYTFIKELLERDEKIPARVIKKFLSYFKKLPSPNAKITARIKYISEKVYSKYEGGIYDFSFTIKGKVITHEDQKDVRLSKLCSLKEMISGVSQSLYWGMAHPSILRDKDKCIGYVYQRLVEYRDTNLKGKNKALLSDYAVAALSSYFALVMGFKLAEKTPTTNEELYQASRNAIKKIKKKKPQA